MPGGLPSVHVFPPSRVTLINPLLVPTQINPRPTVDSEMDSIAPPGGAALPGAVGGVGPPGRPPRSGLNAVQCAPLSVLAHSHWNPASSMSLFHGANAIGCHNPLRHLR